jgi:hypothetical protein
VLNTASRSWVPTKDLDADTCVAGHKAAPDSEERRAAVVQKIAHVAKIENNVTRCGLRRWGSYWHGKRSDVRDGG